MERLLSQNSSLIIENEGLRAQVLTLHKRLVEEFNAEKEATNTNPSQMTFHNQSEADSALGVEGTSDMVRELILDFDDATVQFESPKGRIRSRAGVACSNARSILFAEYLYNPEPPLMLLIDKLLIDGYLNSMY